MRRVLLSLVMACILAFSCVSGALAVEALTLEGVRMNSETGTLYLTGTTDFPDEQDLTFKASTENGNLEVSTAVSLRMAGTSWFVVLDYGRNTRGSTDYVLRTENEVLAGISGLVSDIDEGALVLSSSEPAIIMEKPAQFKETLSATPGTTDASMLGNTLAKVMEYIVANRGALMMNVAVVVVTPGDVTTSVISNVESTLNRYAAITTHIICTAGSEQSYGAAEGGWRDNAAKLAQKASLTVGGTGFITDMLSSEWSEKAVNRVREAERKLVFLVLNPRVLANVGKELTITQTTSGGKNLTATGIISDDLYDAWHKYWEDPVPATDDGGTSPGSISMSTLTTASTYFNTGIDNSIQAGSGSTGTSMELIIGIILAVVILVLVVVLIILKTGKGKKAKTGSNVVSAPAAAVATGVVVTLRDTATGHVYKGEMKSGRLVIGREAGRGAMLAIPGDVKLSGVHATITRQGSVMTIADNNSMNGTKVNGNRITSPVVLQQNDTITMGSNTYSVSWHA